MEAYYDSENSSVESDQFSETGSEYSDADAILAHQNTDLKSLSPTSSSTRQTHEEVEVDENSADWARLFSSLLIRLDDASKREPATSNSPKHVRETVQHLLLFVKKVVSSPSFLRHVSGSVTAQFTNSFLPQCIGSYMARYLAPQQLESLVKYIEAHLETIIFRSFRGSRDYTMYYNPSCKDARVFALQCALHKRYPLLATEGYASLSRPPVFYLTEGFPMFESLDRHIWDLTLTRDSFRVIPLRSCSPQSNLNVGVDVDAGTESQQVAGSEDMGVFPSFAIDLEALEHEIQQDKLEGRLPCAILATCGASVIKPYQSDNLRALRQICDRHSIWLHVEGSSVLLGSAPEGQTPQSVYAVFETANSVVLEPTEWFHARSPASLTLLKSSKAHSHHHRHLIPPPVPITQTDFSALFTLWYQFLALHPSAEEDVSTARHLHHTFFGLPLSQSSSSLLAADQRTARSLDVGNWHLSNFVGNQLEMCRYLRTGLLSRTGFPVTLGPGSQHPHVVLFQVCPPDSMALPLSELNLDLNGLNKALFARLYARYRSRSCRHLQEPTVTDDFRSEPDTEERKDPESSSPDTSHTHEPPPLPISQIMYDERVAFLFHPLAQRDTLGSASSLHELGGKEGEFRGGKGTLVYKPISKASVDAFLNALSSEMQALEFAARARRPFQHLVQEAEELEYISPSSVQGFVGIGCFRFVPAFSVPPAHVNALNAHLANLLSAKNSLYRGAVTADQMVCTVIQATTTVPADTDTALRDIVSEVMGVAAKMVLPKEVVDGLSQVVLQGIRAAEQRIQETTEQQYRPDKLLRQVPLVGKLWGWLRPPDAEAKTEETTSQSFDIRSQSLSKPSFLKPSNSARASPRDPKAAVGPQQQPAPDRSDEVTVLGMSEASLETSRSSPDQGTENRSATPISNEM